MKYLTLIAFATLLFLASCGGNDEDTCVSIPDTKNIAIELHYTSLTDSLVNITSKADLVALLNKHAVLRETFFNRAQYPNDSAFINKLYEKFTNIHIDTLAQEVKRVFDDEQNLKAELIQAFKNMKYYYPETTIPRIETVISGLETDMVVSDSLIIISLDYFLGKDGRFRPNMYEYLLRQYNPENIVPSIMLMYGIDSRINRMDADNKTALADMITYGKSFYFAKHMVPCAPDSILIWYTPAEITGARENQDLIWARFVEDKLLYSTSHMLKQKYLGDRPKTAEVGPDCPGRIGQWVGWQIVKNFMKENPDHTLNDLMNSGNADKIFKEAKYKPVRR
jgi:gliding motility-associated lipoprotein GldB